MPETILRLLPKNSKLTSLNKNHNRLKRNHCHSTVLRAQNEKLFADTTTNLVDQMFPLTKAVIGTVVQMFVSKEGRLTKLWRNNLLSHGFGNHFAARNYLRQRLATYVKEFKSIKGSQRDQSFLRTLRLSFKETPSELRWNEYYRQHRGDRVTSNSNVDIRENHLINLV